MRRVLRRHGYRYLRGQARNYMAESAANVAFRARYLRKLMSNRDASGNPIVPEDGWTTPFIIGSQNTPRMRKTTIMAILIQSCFNIGSTNSV
ncbi:hypothetical protein ACHHYP_20532 [Achlya hypogyna]|uniref:Uncharacterized protein n=1 Tax=Achlya hypogyna TaxID=1202772 RepID=A0A1V9YJJ4_ACHHY|nr:hypothetical protein ACHHYP_20532 [Achlya hypogyna]